MMTTKALAGMPVTPVGGISEVICGLETWQDRSRRNTAHLAQWGATGRDLSDGPPGVRDRRDVGL